MILSVLLVTALSGALTACTYMSTLEEVAIPAETPTESSPQRTTPVIEQTPVSPFEPILTPSFEPSAAWEKALVEYLEQFWPIFHNIRYVETARRSFWRSDWYDFVERYEGDALLLENSGYGYTYFYRDPITGERLAIDDVPYLSQRSGTWYDDNGESHTWLSTQIATHFNLFNFNNTDIPELVIYWSMPCPNNLPAQPATLHRFQNGAFEFAKELSMWESIGFYSTEDGRVFIEYQSTVAHMVDIRLMHLNDEIIIEPVLSTDGWTGTLYNHLSGEYFLRYDDGSMRWKGLSSTENKREEVLGISLMRIEPMKALQERFIELISVRFS